MKILQAKKCYEFIFESNKIEFFKTYIFKEFVSVNGETVSEKITIKGTEHFLKINSTEILLQTKRRFLLNRKFKINLFVNRKLIESKTLVSTRKVRIYS